MKTYTYPGSFSVRHGAGMGCGMIEADLECCGTGVENHVLTITKRVRLLQCNPPTVPPGFSGNVDALKPWSIAAWEAFKAGFLQATRLWHNRFVLVPPRDEDNLKYKEFLIGGPVYMPNVECRLKVVLLEASGDPHSTASVAYLEAGDGVGGYVRSDAGFMTNQDVGIKEPAAGGGPRAVRQSVLAHEFGHMLGQPHIGVLANATDCREAMAGRVPAGKEFVMSGGANAYACYGWTGNEKDMSLFHNIMGGGLGFSEVNAMPWKLALGTLLNKPDKKLPDAWRVIVDGKENTTPTLIKGA